MTIVITLIVTALVGGGTSIAANGALPGGMLYGVKTGFNESVKSFFSFGAEAKANTEAELALRRVEEMEKLSVKGKIDAKIAAEVEARFNSHSARASKLMSQLDTEDSLEASAEFESALGNHRAVLLRLTAKESDDADVLIALSSRVGVAASEARKTRANAEAKVTADASINNESRAQGKLGAAENKIAEVTKYLALKTEVSVGAKAAAEAKLAQANNILVQGKAKLEAKAYAEAFILFQSAHQSAQEAKMAITSDLDTTLNLNLQLNNSGNTNSANDGRNDDDNEAELKVNTEIDGRNTNNSGKVEVKVGL